jgi:hypothetical protein
VFVHKNLLLSLFVRETSKNEKTIQWIKHKATVDQNSVQI